MNTNRSEEGKITDNNNENFKIINNFKTNIPLN